MTDTSPATREIQPPTPGKGDCWVEIITEAHRSGWPEQVLDLMRARRQLGIERYGQPLQHGDGRGLDDALQEALDLAVYLWRDGHEMMAWDALRLMRQILALKDEQ